jgi:glycosyltransferase involved in cell wall biosynthesis
LGSYQKINLFISPSLFLINKFQEFGFKGKMEYIPNSLSTFFRGENFENENAGPLVFYGRLSKEKGIDVVIRAMQKLEKETLWIVGEGPEKNNLIDLVKKFNLESKVIFLGFKSGQELKNILNQAKAVIIPSIWYENMPYTVAEALAMGKIIVASRIGGIPDLISDKENGFLFEAGNRDDLTRTIKNLENFDITKIKKNAEKIAEELNEEKFYKKIMKIYNEVDNNCEKC